MRHQTQTTLLTLALSLTSLTSLLPAFSASARAEGGAAAQVATDKPDLEKVRQHLRQHQKYPATRAELLASCNDLVDFSAGEKRWFADHLHEGTYHSADEVLKAIARK